MKTIQLFGYDKSGESRLWWSWQNLNRNSKEQVRGWAKHGRAWLHTPTNCYGIEWNLFARSCRFGVTFSDVGDEAVVISLAIPFVIAIWFSVERAKWVKRLPGVKWSGKWGSGERELGRRIFDCALWWALWTYPGGGGNEPRWRDSCFHFDDFILGRNKYSESDNISGDYLLVMSEGAYPVKVELHTSTWKRPRWPWSQSVRRASIETEHGIPIPGKPDSDFYDGDDSLFGGTYLADTVEQALQKMHDSVIRDRLRYGGSEWMPDAGWPTHCLQG